MYGCLEEIGIKNRIYKAAHCVTAFVFFCSVFALCDSDL